MRCNHVRWSWGPRTTPRLYPARVLALLLTLTLTATLYRLLTPRQRSLDDCLRMQAARDRGATYWRSVGLFGVLRDLFRGSRDQKEHFGDREEDFRRYGGNGTMSAGPRKSVILWSRWRMGSSFVGELLATTSLKTFYSYEPLHPFSRGVLYHNTSVTRAGLRYLRHLLQCRLLEHEAEARYFSEMVGGGLAGRDSAMAELCWQRCCHHSVLVERVCRRAEMVVAKVVKLRLVYAHDVLSDSDLDTHVIFLVRDPRAVMHSRLQLPWCRAASCASARESCRILQDDLQQVQQLLQQYPTRFHFLRYELLSSYPRQVLDPLWGALGLPRDDLYRASVRAHVAPPHRWADVAWPLFHQDAYTTRRDAAQHVHAWRARAAWSHVQYVQNACSDVLHALGLHVFTSEEELRNLSISALDGKDR